MSPDDIIHHMACDFSQCMSYALPDWEYNDEPADAYMDTIVSGFGDAPTETSVIRDYKSRAAVAAIKARLNKGFETDIFTEEIIDQLVRRAIINNFGPDALS
ncbi:MAG: hypothetical protein ABJZ55_07170 [Fuerstiella sp.]